MADAAERLADSLFVSHDPELDFLIDTRNASSPLLREHPAAAIQAQLVDAVEILRRQREQALHDLDALHQAKLDALADPEGFILRLRTNTLPKLPTRQVVFPLPSLDPPRAVETPQQPPTRKRRGADVSTPPMRKSSSLALAKLRESAERERGALRSPPPPRSVNTNSMAPPSGNETSKPALAASTDKLFASPPSEEEQRSNASVAVLSASDLVKLRSRPSQDEKKANGGGAWTLAEQRRLEQLLVEYPDEPVSSHRWDKIARALGHRTPKQVARRVQQFFVRLALQNKPLPGGGKPPNLDLYLNKRRREGLEKKRRQGVAGVQAPAVYMSDDESASEEPDLADLDEEFKGTEEYKELVRLRKLQAERRREAHVRVVHFDYRCDCCGMDPIEGPRFRCTDCPADDELDLCEACLAVDFESGNHLKSHRFERISDARDADVLFRDDDYSWCDPTDQLQYLNPTFLIS